MLLSKNVPLLLTLLRILLIPFFVFFYYLPIEYATLVAAAIFGLAALTDWLDGYLARRWNQTSALGAFLDPVADKLMVLAALIMLTETFAVYWMTIPVIIIIGREVIISALREWMAELGKRADVAVSAVGKLKTALQMVAIFLLVAGTGYSISFWSGLIILYLATVLTLWSMISYLRAAWPYLINKR